MLYLIIIKEKEISLYIDQIYGKIKSLSVASNFNSISWDEMINNDMKDIQVTNIKFDLPKESEAHIDVYKIECEIPLLLNFYYVDETEDISKLNYGQTIIKTLNPYQSISFPISENIVQPELTIEIFNPLKIPLVVVDDGQDERIIDEKSLIISKPFLSRNRIFVKEKKGQRDTRIIIKVGYNVRSWPLIGENIFYNSILNMYVYYLPNDKAKLNYTFINLVTRGEGDNVKYC